MKRYVWTAAAVLFVNAYASENPFALKENLQKIDNDQEVLLSELRQLAEARDQEDDDVDDIVASPVEPEPAQEEVIEETPVKMADSEEQYNLANAIDQLVGGSASAQTKASAKDDDATEVQRAIKEAQAREEERQAVAAYEKQRAERLAREAQAAAELKAQKEAQAREEERQAVAAYEKQRAERLAQEEKAKKEAEQKVAAIDIEAEKKAAKETAETGYSEAVKEMGGEAAPVVEQKIVQAEQVQTTAPKQDSSVDEIDVAAEQRAAKEAADAAYLAAVREMDQEEE